MFIYPARVSGPARLTPIPLSLTSFGVVVVVVAAVEVSSTHLSQWLRRNGAELDLRSSSRFDVLDREKNSKRDGDLDQQKMPPTTWSRCPETVQFTQSLLVPRRPAPHLRPNRQRPSHALCRTLGSCCHPPTLHSIRDTFARPLIAGCLR